MLIDSPEMANPYQVIPRIKGLVAKYVSATTIDIDIASCRYLKFDTSLDVTFDVTDGVGLNAWDDDGDARVSGYDGRHMIWLLINSTTGVLATVAAYNKTAPDITNSAFDGYKVVTLLTSFITDTGSTNIVQFWKVGNMFHCDKIVVATHSGTGVTSAAIGTSVPLIDEIESFRILTYTNGNTGCDRFEVGYFNVRGDDTICTMDEWDVGGTLNPGKLLFTAPHIQNTIYCSTPTGSSANYYLAVRGYITNNIIGA